MKKSNDGYYHFEDDLLEYPEAWCYIVWSPRGSGKTYSGLWYSYETKTKILYMKRTIDDVKLICSDSSEFDPSPYVPINRDKGTCVHSKELKKGVGAFYDCIEDEQGKYVPSGAPVSYIAALNAIKSIKGFDLSICDWILLDEFIPQVGEIVKHGEGEMLLDVYMTVSRDRQKRGLPPLKLVLFANAEDISTPITNTLEVVDLMADLNASGKTHYYDKERGILLHHITRDEYPMQEKEKTGIYAAMKGTAWGAKAFEGTFSNNDFSNVAKVNLKNAKPVYHLHYKQKDYYIYQKTDGSYYMCDSKQNCRESYDLNKENDQKRFLLTRAELREACIEGRMRFQKYSMYDLIINYTKIFRL